jgi:uncharacterized protein
MLGLIRFLAVTAGVVYLIVLGLMYVLQRDLQYKPLKGEISVAGIPSTGLEKVTLITPDREAISAIYKPPVGDAPVIIYVHGNGGNLMTRPKKIATYANSQFGLLAVSYRGYGDSTGSPSEAGLVQDAVAAFDWLQQRVNTKGNVVVVGESLGSGVAVQLSALRPVRALALEAPYANAVDIGAETYWYLPVRWLMKDQFRSSEFIGKVTVPLLVQHGTEDAVVPFQQGEALFALANEPKKFIALAGEGHEIIGDEKVWQREIAFFGDVTKTPAVP